MTASVTHRNGLFRRWHEAGNECVPPTDVQIVTSDGKSIPAHSSVLASASPVLERMLDRSRKGGNSERIIHVLGVPHDAVLVFLQFLYSSRTGMWSREAEEEMERHGIALLALSHAYRVRWLKRRSEACVAAWLSAVKVMDVLKLARLCDAPRLYQRCMRLVAKDLEAVQQSEGWRFVQKHDPGLEMEVLQFLQETSQREKRWRRERGDQDKYRQLSEAMDCLKHICTEGCTDVGPHNSRPPAYPCTSFSTCEGLQLLIRHFAACGRKLSPKGCTHCKRMWQLLRLHSSLCDQLDSCRVPLCEQFKKKVQEEKVDRTWRLLVKKVATARVMSSLANRKVPEIVQKSRMRYRGTR
ncbi:hypothetical protein C4D60_Mb06t21350 [Musa balbisiana]|uniref:BTB domain-containing protein n=1 Tax=Musa balbisiana TaxID=52838 RepID=A0A4S8IPM6_MUSBA|nr:hypothetical protein C4D60_Mb06t21350 [Musa balbisiana]